MKISLWVGACIVVPAIVALVPLLRMLVRALRDGEYDNDEIGG